MRESDEVPEMILSDEGREFGKVKVCSTCKLCQLHTCILTDRVALQHREGAWPHQLEGRRTVSTHSSIPYSLCGRFTHVAISAVVFEKQCNGNILETGQTVSFVHEEGEKGPIAKDIRIEDPARVARVTATVHYGKVKVSWSRG